jgi:hypothetical protein
MAFGASGGPIRAASAIDLDTVSPSLSSTASATASGTHSGKAEFDTEPERYLDPSGQVAAPMAHAGEHGHKH